MRKPLLVSISPLVALSAALLLAGCQTVPPGAPSSTGSASAGDDAASATPEPTDPVTRPACALASAAVVKSTLGLTVGEPSESFDDSEILCTYTSTAGNNPVVKFRTGQDAASFARLRREADSSGDPTRDVEVGQEAYVTAEEFGNQVSNTLVVRSGSVILSVTANVSVELERAFATKVLASLA